MALVGALVGARLEATRLSVKKIKKVKDGIHIVTNIFACKGNEYLNQCPNCYDLSYFRRQ